MTCPGCGGTGVLWDDEMETEWICATCNGTGKVPE